MNAEQNAGYVNLNNLVRSCRVFGEIFQRFRLFKNINYPRPLPVNITLATTYKCNSRCQTCNIWKTYIEDPRKEKSELAVKEYENVFRTIGRPYWVTITGGEPFLRDDLDEMVISLCRIAGPIAVNIASNGSLPERIFFKVKNILKECKGTRITLNLSLDHIGVQNDIIRGQEGSFRLLLDTFSRLKSLKHKNFTLGIHTVISRYNVKDISGIYDYVSGSLLPDSFNMENAQVRKEFRNTGRGDILLDGRELAEVLDFFISSKRKIRHKGFERAIRAFRKRYYASAKYFIKKGRTPYECLAGFCSCHINPFGDVNICPVEDYPMGNLADTDYNFKELWLSRTAGNARDLMKKRNCSCLLANAAYTNMLMDIKSLAGVGLEFLKSN